MDQQPYVVDDIQRADIEGKSLGRPRRLGRRLVVSLCLFSAVITTVLTGVELLIDYRKDVSAVEDRLQQIEAGTVNTVAGAIWNIDIPALKTQLGALLHVTDVDYVAIDSTGLALEFGKPATQNVLVRHFSLMHEQDGALSQIGTLTVHASLENALQRTWQRLWIILGGQALKTFLVSIFFLFFFHYLVTRHLFAITEFAYQARNESYGAPLRLPGKRPSVPDELDYVVEMLNSMIDKNLSLYLDVNNQKQQLQSILDNTTAVIYIKDLTCRFLLINRQFELLFHVKNAEAGGKTDYDIFPRETADIFRANDMRVLDANAAIEWEEEATHIDGIHTYLSLKFPLVDTAGNTYAICGISTDITQRVRAEAALYAEKERAQVTLDSIGDAVITTNVAGCIDYLNPVAERLTGWRCVEAIRQPLDDVFKVINELTRLPITNPVQLVLNQGMVVGLTNHSVLIRRDGSELPVEDCGAPIRDRDGKIVGVVLVFHDVSLTHRMAAQMLYQATYDALTGLPNRRLLLDRFDHAVKLASRNKQHLILFFLDLDHFKNVNDSLGHPMGDKLLKQVAARLLACVRASDTVSRQGGDEFIILVESMESSDFIAQLAEKILAAIAAPYLIDEHNLTISATIGISAYPDDGIVVEDLIKNADAAMYQAKAQGRNNYKFFTADMNVRAIERLNLENALRHALKSQEFLLYYQPKISLSTGCMIGAEALVRWRHPQAGIVSPSLFIPTAEDCGLILPLGHWVLREACRQIRAWQDAGLFTVPVAVNLSAAQFKKKSLVQDVANALEQTGLDSSHLELELSESMMMEGQQDLETITSLKALGIGLSVDDFGTGYSSLSYLRRFPIDSLKIDQAFVRNIASQPDDDAVVFSIINLAHSLRLKVIAEGVETEEQLDILRAHGCDQIQGFYFSKPIPAEDFQTLLHPGKHIE